MIVSLLSSINLAPKTLVELKAWRDGHKVETFADGTVIRYGPRGCECSRCQG